MLRNQKSSGLLASVIYIYRPSGKVADKGLDSASTMCTGEIDHPSCKAYPKLSGGLTWLGRRSYASYFAIALFIIQPLMLISTFEVVSVPIESRELSIYLFHVRLWSENVKANSLAPYQCLLIHPFQLGIGGLGSLI